MEGSEGSPESERSAITAFMNTHHLSPQEARLVRASLRELSNEEIADELGCSPSTVRTYWSRIFQKIGCSERHHVLARIANFLAVRIRSGSS